MKCAPALLALSLVLPGVGVASQTPQDSSCAAFLATLEGRQRPRATCRTLAVVLVDSITQPYYTGENNTGIPPRDVQSTRAGDAGPTGSAAQAEAVPGVQPSALAAATIATAATDGGTEALTSISINPSLLFGPNDTRSLARWSRFTDLTISFPVSDIEGLADGLDYLALRARVNMTAAQSGDAAFEGALAAYKKVLQDENVLLEGIIRALTRASDVERCARSIQASRLGDKPEGCNADLTIDLAPGDYRELKETIALARERADAKYLGLDLRFETGDPTLGSVPGTEVRTLEAGVAWGRRFLKPKLQELLVGVRARVGGRYVDPISTGEDVVWSATGGIALEGSRLMTLEQVARFTLGFEFDYANAPEAQREALGTDFLTLRGSLAIPLVGSSVLSVGFAVPVAGEESPSLSFNFGGSLMMAAVVQGLTGRTP